jgi:heat shock protein HslJ
MRTNQTHFLFTILVGLWMAGCSITQTLSDTTWVLINLNGAAVLDGTIVTLNFAKDQLNGTDGCNLYSGTYALNGSEFTIGNDLISTQMACQDAIMQQASAYIFALMQTFSYKIENQQLMWLDVRGNVLAIFAAQSQELSGTAWLVTGYNNGNQGVVSVLNGSTLTADFSADGAIGGSAGCNSYGGTYEAKENVITIGSLASTMMFCAEPPELMDQETQFLNALAMAATYRIDGNRLELRSVEGALAVSLEKAP